MSHNLNIFKSIEVRTIVSLMLAFVVTAYMPTAIAQTAFGTACTTVEGFVTNLVTLLRFISVGVVTVAIIFAGYQIAFAHKRFSDVATILIGGLLIGGAGQIAAWFVSGATAAPTAC